MVDIMLMQALMKAVPDKAALLNPSRLPHHLLEAAMEALY
jgi:hypothetical protein